MSILGTLDRWLGRVIGLGAVLVLPLSLLLFAQWPLRDLVHGGSREANDLAQLLFGLYVSMALSYATRHGSHLTPDAVAQHYPAAFRQTLNRWAACLIVLPWACFVLFSAAPAAWQSLLQREAFPETFNPGYFILKLSVCLLAALMLLQAIVDVAHPKVDPSPETTP